MKALKKSIKPIIIVVILLLFLIPLGFIKDLANERENVHDNAISSIVKPLGDEAYFYGTYLAIPYHEFETISDEKGNVTKEVKTNYLMVAPNIYDIDIDIESYNLSRGIFTAPVFNGNMKINASFDKFDLLRYGKIYQDININEALLVVAISKKKNLTSEPKIKINNIDLNICSDNADFSSLLRNEVILYNLDAFDLNNKLELTGDISFQGGNSIGLRPIGDYNTFSIKSNWDSPSFYGDFLPTKRNIDKNGFTATWNIPGISTSNSNTWILGFSHYFEMAKIDFISPVNNYTKIFRSMKYAFLFLCIPFLVLIVLEIVTKLKIHPIQYITIGVANIIFYLLLISISEHINFNLSYVISCICTMFSTFIYVKGITGSLKTGIIFVITQFISYIFLYATLQSEDYALLIGSVGIFILILIFMIMTRKVDWYKLDESRI